MSEPTELCLLAEKYGTDKCPQIKHAYTPLYYELLKDRRDEIRKVLEFGVGYCYGGKATGRQAWDRKYPRTYYRGASLFMWRDFFPRAMVYGADCEQTAMFEDERIKTFLCDETKEDDLLGLLEQTGTDIDLFVDDASHLPGHQVFLARAMLPRLKKGVFYIIEDVAFPEEVAAALSEYDCFCPALPVDGSQEKMMVVLNPC